MLQRQYNVVRGKRRHLCKTHPSQRPHPVSGARAADATFIRSVTESSFASVSFKMFRRTHDQ